MFDFAENETVDDINSVPEQFRGAYVEAEGGGSYIIAAHAKGLVESVTGLNKALTASRKEAKDYKGKAIDPKTIISGIGDFEDADAVKAHIAGLETTVAEGGKINLDKIKGDHGRAIEDLKATHSTEIAGMASSLEKYMVNAAAATSLAGAKGNAALLMPHVRSKAKVVKEGDDYVTRILDVDGDYRTDGKGGFMTIDDLVAEMKTSKDFAAAFESEAHPGGGARPGTSQRANPTRQKASDMTSREKIAAGLAARK